MSWQDIETRKRMHRAFNSPEHTVTATLRRVRMSASTFREDPLPDRPLRARERGVSLPKFKCLENA